MITAGIDCGAQNTQAVVIKDRTVIGRATAFTGFDPSQAVEASLAAALAGAAIRREDVCRIGATGSGRESIQWADHWVNDIKALTTAARFITAKARTVVDVGAEEGRAAKIDATGRPIDFAVNDKCAAGAGAFIDAMARALEVTVPEMGAICLQSDKEIFLNAQCVIFAESEVIGLIHANTDRRDISRAIHDAVAGRIAAMIRRIGAEADVVLIGGTARNPGFVSALQRKLNLSRIVVPEAPEFGAALGAAIVACDDDGR